MSDNIETEKTCDKCLLPVNKKENLAQLYAEIGIVEALASLNSPNRHIRCSPSRAQYIVHKDFPPVVDNRPDFDKRRQKRADRIAQEKIYTNAWLALNSK